MTQIIINRVAEIEAAYESSINALKNEYLAIIRDENLSLEDRWSVFAKMPMSLKEVDSYIHHFDFESTFNVSWFDDFYVDRYQTVNMVTIVDQLDGDEDKAELKIAIMTECIRDNLGGFVMDW